MYRGLFVYKEEVCIKKADNLYIQDYMVADGFQLHTEQYLSNEIILSPIQDLLNKRGQVRLTVWL